MTGSARMSDIAGGCKLAQQTGESEDLSTEHCSAIAVIGQFSLEALDVVGGRHDQHWIAAEGFAEAAEEFPGPPRVGRSDDQSQGYLDPPSRGSSSIRSGAYAACKAETRFAVCRRGASVVSSLFIKVKSR